jgi:hypothetical protein
MSGVGKLAEMDGPFIDKFMALDGAAGTGNGAIDNKTKELVAKDGMLVASHLARTLHVSHEETEKILSEAGIITAYDGMKLLI